MFSTPLHHVHLDGRTLLSRTSAAHSSGPSTLGGGEADRKEEKEKGSRKGGTATRPLARPFRSGAWPEELRPSTRSSGGAVGGRTVRRGSGLHPRNPARGASSAHTRAFPGCCRPRSHGCPPTRSRLGAPTAGAALLLQEPCPWLGSALLGILACTRVRGPSPSVL